MTPTVLIAHSHSAERSRIAQLLNAAGYAVRECDTAKAIFDLIQSEPPDLVLLNGSLAGENTSELPRQIKEAASRAKAVAVVGLSEAALGDTPRGRRAPDVETSGADGFLNMPIGDSDFLQWVLCYLRVQASENAIRKSNRRWSALIRAQHEIGFAGTSRQDVMRVVAVQAQQLTGADGAAVELVEGEEMVCRAASGIAAPQMGRRIKIGENLSDVCVRSEEELRCDDTESDPRVDREACRDLGVRSLAVAPLRHQYNSLGVLKVFSAQPRFFGEPEMEMLQLVIHFMAGAINQAVASDAKQALLAEHTKTIVALRESEERFRSAFDYAPIGMGLVGTDGRWMKVNRTLCEIVGYSEQELRSRTFPELMHAGDLPHYLENANKLLAAESGSFQMEERHLHKSGRIVWILLSVSLLRDAHGKPLYFIAQMQDITERKRAEEASARLTAILEATTDFVGTLALDGQTLYLNRAFRELVGIGPQEEIVPKQITEYHPHWAAEIITREGFPTAIREGTWSGETALLSHVGREIPTSQVIIAHKDAKGQIAYFSTVARDIAERKRAEEALIMQARVLQNMSEGVCLLDEAGTIVYSNAAQQWMFGYASEELHGAPMTMLNSYPPEENARIASEIFRHVKNHGLWSGELNNRHKSGRQFTTAASISLLEISGRRYFVCVQEDITEKKRADEQLKKSLREKDVLLKEIHHRVKNNLQVISSLLNLQSGYIEDLPTHELFRESQNRVRSMALIHEKLYKSHDLARIDFPEYVFSLVSMLFRSYGTNSGAVKLELHIAPISLNIDTAIPVGLLLNELVSNSLKYAFPNGRAGTISVDFHGRPPDEYALTFRDDGVGMPQNFDFDKSPSLGLRLVKILTNQLGGELAFDRSRGTEFTITFKEQKDKERN